jgi:hypothetical protein
MTGGDPAPYSARPGGGSDYGYGRPAEASGRYPARGDGGSTSLADLLERVLDKGIVIAGDITVNLVDIELLTIKIRLLIASVDRAKEMGIDWWENDPALSSRAADRRLAEENQRLRRELDARTADETERSGIERPETVQSEIERSEIERSEIERSEIERPEPEDRT